MARSEGKKLTLNANVVELGCGTGCVGLVGTGFLDIKSLLLTDGNPQAIQIARLNINQLVSNHNAAILPLSSSAVELLSSSLYLSAPASSTLLSNYTNILSSPSSICDIHCETFLWSLNSKVSASLYNHFNHKQPFDIVLGCELMYYRTDMNLLLSTVLNLIHRQNGLFIHCHVFRGESVQETALIDILKVYQWSSLTVPINTFVDSVELNQHPDWYNVCLLISGPVDVIHQLLSEHTDWKLFQNYFQPCEYNCDEGNIFSSA